MKEGERRKCRRAKKNDPKISPARCHYYSSSALAHAHDYPGAAGGREGEREGGRRG